MALVWIVMGSASTAGSSGGRRGVDAAVPAGPTLPVGATAVAARAADIGAGAGGVAGVPVTPAHALVSQSTSDAQRRRRAAGDTMEAG
jgi:hypothetical protein